MVPIYEQIMEQIKAQIISGELKENDILPSVRTMAKELKISALTVKKAYDNLEAEGMTVTVHGKGTYVAASNTQLMEEERRKEVETDLEAAIQKGRRCGMKEEEIRSLFELIISLSPLDYALARLVARYKTWSGRNRSSRRRCNTSGISYRSISTGRIPISSTTSPGYARRWV